MILIIDNYDSFTYNLVHYVQELGAQTEVYRNDALRAEDVLAQNADGIILSPGPCDPDRAGICLELLRLAPDDLPILGVCLGHQAIGQVFGGKVIRAKSIMHGKTSPILHDGSGVFKNIPDGFEAARYHSLAVERDNLPDCLHITAQTRDGEIMGLSHKSRPVHGVQFHPESIASDHGHQVLQNFMNFCAQTARAA
ncbi:MAG: aminodeoxychorismate/anthranilate synthase component II [Robiginitomaculum sp.]|nr:MAG: aminodeoxychorismate/anthranilate synthase component II [Robiginitomaculum sp.]